MKKRVSTMRKEISNQNKEKDVPSNTLSGYETNIPLHGLKFTPTPKHNNIELNLT